jgi:hypothetical protein
LAVVEAEGADVMELIAGLDKSYPGLKDRVCDESGQIRRFINVFAAYLFDTDDPSVSFGVGPLLGVPTATEDEVGTGQWSAGAAAVLFDARSSVIQYGGLVTYQTKIAGSDRVDDLSLLAVQPFGFLQLGSGVYFRSVGIWAFDLESGDYSIPIGAGLGKVVKMGKVVFNFYLEPQYTVLHEGAGQPEYQVLFGFNTQLF